MSNYIFLTRSDIPEGVLQITDLLPNTSLKNNAYDPTGQTGYVSFRVQNDTVVTSGAGPIVTVGTLNGLAAYLIDNIENTGTVGTPALTATQANNIAAAIIADMDAGAALTAAAIDVLINAEAGVTGAGLQVGNSTGGVGDILLILAGDVYTLPSGSQVEDGANAFDTSRKGAFASPSRVKSVVTSGYFNISITSGQLYAYSRSTFEYGGIAGRAVAVYDDEGNFVV